MKNESSSKLAGFSERLQRDLDAAAYRQNSNLQKTYAEELLAKKIAWKGTEKILDIGCGDGRITRAIAEKVPHGKVVGVDSSKAMISLAKKAKQLQNLFYFQMRAEEVSFENEFDWVISFSCFHRQVLKYAPLNSDGCSHHLLPTLVLDFRQQKIHYKIAH